MTVGDIKKILEVFPDTMPVNVYMEYKSGMILRAQGVQINYIDKSGTIRDQPTPETIEISFFVQESMLTIRRITEKNKID